MPQFIEHLLYSMHLFIISITPYPSYSWSHFDGKEHIVFGRARIQTQIWLQSLSSFLIHTMLSLSKSVGIVFSCMLYKLQIILNNIYFSFTWKKFKRRQLHDF